MTISTCRSTVSTRWFSCKQPRTECLFHPLITETPNLDTCYLTLLQSAPKTLYISYSCIFYFEHACLKLNIGLISLFTATGFLTFTFNAKLNKKNLCNYCLWTCWHFIIFLVLSGCKWQYLVTCKVSRYCLLAYNKVQCWFNGVHVGDFPFID